MSWLTGRMATGEARILGLVPSKTCGHCGRINRGLVLADRTWMCPGCGVLHDRDENAAGNLLAAMLADTTA
jgi:putative transposase